MSNITNSKFSSTMTAIVCTILFSATCVLSAVGPAQAAGSNTGTPSPVVRIFA
ncbi:MAG: hypothetical protein ACREVG_05625 [Burkholderiales bacterium]